MFKKLFLFLLLFSTLSFAQKRELDAKIVTWENDTVNLKLQVITNIFWKDLLNELSVNRKLIKINAEGKKEKLAAVDVKELYFTDFKNVERKFVNITADRSMLHELVHDGKIKWYREYYPHGYDGSVQVSEIFINDQGKSVTVGLFNNMKKKLAEITSSKPELAAEIEKIKISKDSILEILKKYDE